MITSIEELKQIAEASEVELPGFTSDSSFKARLKRPSITTMVSSGNIPNPLLSAAQELFKKGNKRLEEAEGEEFKEMCELLVTVAKAALVSPTYAEIEEAGLSLTDQQITYIFMYVQSGFDTLKFFRENPELLANNEPGEEPERETE